MSMWEDIGQWGLNKVCSAGSGKDFCFVKKDAIQRFPFPSSHLVVWGCDAWSCYSYLITATAAKSLQSCPALCNPIDGSPSGSPIPGILQARTLEWVAIAFSNAWKWKVKVKSLSRVQLLATPWTAAHQAPPSMGFSRQEYWSGVPLPSLYGILFSHKKEWTNAMCSNTDTTRDVSVSQNEKDIWYKS